MKKTIAVTCHNCQTAFPLTLLICPLCKPARDGARMKKGPGFFFYSDKPINKVNNLSLVFA